MVLTMVKVAIDFYVARNSTGHIVKFDGVAWMMFEWLSAASVNTTYITNEHQYPQRIECYCINFPDSILFLSIH